MTLYYAELSKNPEELHINHGAWLGRYEYFATFHSGETQYLLIAVKLIPLVTFENPNSSNPFQGRFRHGVTIRQPQPIVLPGPEGEVEMTLVDTGNFTVFHGLFDYKFSAEEMTLMPRIAP
jgi:hypothetical protein